ncbi:MAG: hypothetical protein DLM55_01030 [Acidimicrobiales bacterium]|nr:MAG: hypothetical protein DLM55_01030 [Acidimicrobiales bacterium]
MHHAKPRKYRGHHRALVDPRTRYTVAISTALLGAGVVAFGAGSVLPSPDSASATLAGSSLTGSQANASSAKATSGASANSSVAQERTALLNDGGVQLRIAAPAPERLPDWVRPVDGYISSTYGLRFGGTEFHYGLDIAGPIGSPIHAAAAGKVIFSGVQRGYGYLVIIQHEGGVVTYYGHNSVLIAHEGDEVQAGDVISLRGNTGQSTGPHCHFEVRINGVHQDPMPWLHEHGVAI